MRPPAGNRLRGSPAASFALVSPPRRPIASPAFAGISPRAPRPHHPPPAEETRGHVVVRGRVAGMLGEARGRDRWRADPEAVPSAGGGDSGPVVENTAGVPEAELANRAWKPRAGPSPSPASQEPGRRGASRSRA